MKTKTMFYTTFTNAFILAFAMSSLTATAAPIYKVTDDNGKITFTDRPEQYKQTASEVTTISNHYHHNNNSGGHASNSVAYEQNLTSNSEQNNHADNYQTPNHYQLTFKNPNEPRSYRRPAQNIDVSLTINPALKESDSVQILIDGQPVAQGLTASIPTLELNPGEHTLTAQVISNGTATSQVNQTFYVIQNNLVVQKKRALQRKKAVYDSLPWHKKLYFNLRQDNPFADVAN